MTSPVLLRSDRERSAVSAATQTPTENAPSKKRATLRPKSVERNGNDVTQMAYPASAAASVVFAPKRCTIHPAGIERATMPRANAAARPPIASFGMRCASRWTASTAIEVP